MKNTGYISEVVTKINKLPPILVSFEHGDPVPSEVAGLRCAVLQKKTDDKQRLVAVATSHLQHRSRSSSDTGLSTTFIAVRNKKTNKVRLIETEHFVLSPVIAKENNVTAESDVVEVSAQYAQLSKSFGSKMAKRKQDQLEKMKVHADNLEGQLAEVTENIEVADEELNFSNYENISLKELLPPSNPEATSASEVYELTKILSSDEMESLDIICNEILADPDCYSRHSPSPMFISCLPDVLASEDSSRLKALLYADCLTKFLRLTIRDLCRKDLLLCPYSMQISRNIVKNFTVSSGKKRNRSATHRDKALCYVIVLGLLAGGLQLNLEPVMGSLSRTSMKKLQEIKRVVGAVPSKDKPNTIVLKLPLPSLRNMMSSTKLERRRK